MTGFLATLVFCGLTAALMSDRGIPRRDIRDEQACRLTLSARPAVTIRSTENAGLFHRITGGVLVDGGGVVVASSGTQSVLAFTGEGELTRTFGRKGNGPGEFGFLHGLWRLNDSTLMVGDNQKARATFFDQSLQNVRSVALASAAGVRWPAIVGAVGGSLVAINGQAFERGQMGVGTVRPPYQFLRYTTRGALRDTVLVVPGRAFHVPEGSTTRPTRAIPLGADVLFAASNNGLYVMPNDSGRIARVRQPNREEAFATIPTLRRPITRDDVARYKAAQRAEAVTPAQQRAVALLDEIPFPEYFPTADALLVDRDGAVWLRRFAPQSSAPSVWERISRDGRTLCTVHIPSSVRLLDAAGDRVLGVMTDRDGEEFVVVYTLARS